MEKQGIYLYLYSADAPIFIEMDFGEMNDVIHTLRTIESNNLMFLPIKTTFYRLNDIYRIEFQGID